VPHFFSAAAATWQVMQPMRPHESAMSRAKKEPFGGSHVRVVIREMRLIKNLRGCARQRKKDSLKPAGPQHQETAFFFPMTPKELLQPSEFDGKGVIWTICTFLICGLNLLF
jgi:hypothetical protein